MIESLKDPFKPMPSNSTNTAAQQHTALLSVKFSFFKHARSPGQLSTRCNALCSLCEGTSLQAHAGIIILTTISLVEAPEFGMSRAVRWLRAAAVMTLSPRSLALSIAVGGPARFRLPGCPLPAVHLLADEGPAAPRVTVRRGDASKHDPQNSTGPESLPGNRGPWPCRVRDLENDDACA